MRTTQAAGSTPSPESGTLTIDPGEGSRPTEEHGIVVVGVPFDGNSSYLRGAASAPARIREALFSQASNRWTEGGIDLEAATGWRLGPDLELPDGEGALGRIESEVAAILERKSLVIALGGDHSITHPLVRAHARTHPRLSILHLDAHPDLYDELDGNRHSHACPFARIMEEGLAARLVQVGIRTLTGHQREQAERFGVEMIEMRNIREARELAFEGPVYLSLDLDCLDPAFAPGVSHHEPGGMSTRDVLEILHTFEGKLVGADIVEYNPERDVHGMTAMVAAKLLKEILGRILEQGSSAKKSWRDWRGSLAGTGSLEEQEREHAEEVAGKRLLRARQDQQSLRLDKEVEQSDAEETSSSEAHWPEY